MVLYYLRRNDGGATMNGLAEQIAAWENEIEIEELTSQQRKRVYVSLYQTHLPRLAETGMVDYDVDEGTVRLTDQATDMDAFLTPKGTSTYPWRRHYLALLLVGGAVVALGVFAAPFVGSTLLLWLAGGLIAGYVVTAGVEYWHHRKQREEIPAELVPDDL